MTPSHLESVALSCRVCERIDKGRKQEQEEDEAFAARVAQRLRDQELSHLMSETTFQALYQKASEASGKFLVNVNDIVDFYCNFRSLRSGKKKIVPNIPNPFKGVPLDTDTRVSVAKRVWAAIIAPGEYTGLFQGYIPDGSFSMRDWIKILDDPPSEQETAEFWKIFHTPDAIPTTLASRLEEAGIPFPTPFYEEF